MGNAPESHPTTTVVPDSRYPLPLQRFYHFEEDQPQKPFLIQPHNGEVTTWDWHSAGQEARQVAAYLQSLDLPVGSHIALLSKNCAHWIMADLAIWMAGHVSVPLYPTLTAGSVNQILVHSDADLLIVGELDDWPMVKAGVPAGLPCIGLPAGPVDEGFILWSELLQNNEPLQGKPARGPEEIATIVYTSGSTGMPKGVMLNFFAMAAAVVEGSKDVSLDMDDRMLSYLPLSHVAERLVVEMPALYFGFEVYFSEGLDTFGEDLRRARPTLFFSVPRLWTKFQLSVFAKIPKQELDELLANPELKDAVIREVLTKLGLENVRYAGSGSAPISQELQAWYASLGLNILDGYGMSENFGYSFATEPGEEKIGYVGRPRPGVEARLTEEGEIQIRSITNMVGYYKDPKQTREAFTEDGFMRTGDRGEFDAQGRLRITGRTKELFKTSKGKYVAPAPIENKILGHPLVEATCVMGAEMPKPIAVVLLSPEANAEAQSPDGRERIEAELGALYQQVNGQLDPHEALQALVLIADEWTIANGFLTPTLKIKRDVIEGAYSPYLDQWYSGRGNIKWQLT